jgi:hypothetical protein
VRLSMSTPVQWRKSSQSPNESDCVEVAAMEREGSDGS